MILPSSNSACDVVVIGGGPAGATAALGLAEAGVGVTILEKSSLPRCKTCGGGVTGRALRLLPPDVHKVVERECFAAEMNLLDAGLHFGTRREEPIVSMTMRERFDDLLLSKAKRAGARIESSCAVREIVPGGERVELLTSQGSCSARFVVAADGALSIAASSPPSNRRSTSQTRCWSGSASRQGSTSAWPLADTGGSFPRGTTSPRACSPCGAVRPT